MIKLQARKKSKLNGIVWLFVEGRLRTRKWQDQQNNNRFTTEIVANEVHILANRTNSVADDEVAEEYHFNQDYSTGYESSF